MFAVHKTKKESFFRVRTTEICVYKNIALFFLALIGSSSCEKEILIFEKIFNRTIERTRLTVNVEENGLIVEDHQQW